MVSIIENSIIAKFWKLLVAAKKFVTKKYKYYRYGTIILETCIVEEGQLGRDNRIYSKEAVDQIEDQLKQHIEKGIAVGRIINGVPPDVIDLKQISHKINGIKRLDKSLVVELESLPTEKGAELSKIIEHAVFRPTGYGSVDNNGRITDYELISVDAISKSDDAFQT